MTLSVIKAQEKNAYFIELKDSVTGKNISLARVSFGRNRSVLTDEKGKAVLFYTLKEGISLDTLNVVAAGYSPLNYVIRLNKIKHLIYLVPKNVELHEVNISGGNLYACPQGKRKEKISCGGFISTDGRRKGSEVASEFICRSKGCVYLKKVKFLVIKNEIIDTVWLRINFYQLNTKDEPDSMLHSVMIPYFGRGRNTPLEIDAGYIPVKKERRMAVSLECLSEGAGLDSFCFSTDLNNTGWVRYPGYSRWKKIRGGSFWFEAETICGEKNK